MTSHYIIMTSHGIMTVPPPYSVAYIAHGVTAYQNLNYGYRIYTIDGDYTGTTSVRLTVYVFCK